MLESVIVILNIKMELKKMNAGIYKILVKVTDKFRLFPFTRPVIFSLLVMGISGFFIYKTVKKMQPPPEAITHYRFQAIGERIKLYLKNNPGSDIDLNFLPEIPSLSKSIKDGWNNEIQYERSGANIIKLISFGQDGIKGNSDDLYYQLKL